jgi:hypothetical protein
MNSGNGCQRISRRVVLTGTVLALGAAAIPATVSQTAAQVKISQATARYQGTPKGDQRCEGCANFLPPNAGKFVEGHITPNGGVTASEAFTSKAMARPKIVPANQVIGTKDGVPLEGDKLGVLVRAGVGW